MKSLALVLLLPILAGCANINVTPPQQLDFEKARTYNLSQDKAWIRAVDWFSEAGVPIDSIDKSSGLIASKSLKIEGGEYLDCGKINSSGLLRSPNIMKSGFFSITLREGGPERTKININFYGEFQLVAQDSWDGRVVTSKGRCISTGVLENRFLTYMGS